MPRGNNARKSLLMQKKHIDSQRAEKSILEPCTPFKNVFEQGCMGILEKNIELEVPNVFKEYVNPYRYKIAYGGRGGAKSWSYGRLLIPMSMQKKLRVLCCREYQANISQSVHQLLCDIIAQNKLDKEFEITNTKITCKTTGSEFIFKGLHKNPQEIKSLEGVDICWVEEAQSVSKISWDILIPTIRKLGSEIWLSFNPDLETDETYKRFILNTPEGSLVVKVGFRENKWFPETLRLEMEHCKRTDPEAYKNIWEGECRKYSDAQIFKDKFEVCEFETPKKAKFLYGADWGFAQDPDTLIRMFIQDNSLYIDQEAYAIGVDLDQIGALYRKMPDIGYSKIRADNARPETIHHVKKQGFNIVAAKKWGGSIQDGVSIMKSFDKIYIHPRCRHTAEEFRFYSYKVDKLSGEILPVIEDKYNHCIDAIRYALDDFIRGKKPMKFGGGR